jgi:hypothetical protein
MYSSLMPMVAHPHPQSTLIRGLVYLWHFDKLQLWAINLVVEFEVPHQVNQFLIRQGLI